MSAICSSKICDITKETETYQRKYYRNNAFANETHARAQIRHYLANDGATINQQDARFIKHRARNITAARSVFRKDSWESARIPMNSAIRDVSSDKLAQSLDWDGAGCERRENQRKWNNNEMHRGRGRGIEWMDGKYITCCPAAARRR